MQQFNYYFEYEPKSNSFYAFISGIGDIIVYEISNIKMMKGILKSGEMTHIDDMDGLRNMLIHDKILPEGCTLRNRGPVS